VLLNESIQVILMTDAAGFQLHGTARGVGGFLSRTPSQPRNAEEKVVKPGYSVRVR
jgi:hypothetical protein